MIYENIQRLCKEHKTNIHRLERECGLTNGLIGKWSREGINPGVLTVKAVADFFGVTVEELLKDG